jgi:hypothetical protein
MSARWTVLALSLAAACQSGEVRDSLAPTRESAYEVVIAPILRERCVGCHGSERAKGGLRLHTPEAIRAGGSMGAVVVPGNVGASELVRRLHLALDDDEHMPPDDKPQLDAAQIATLERWIAAGAPYEGPVDGLVAPQKAPAPTKMAAADPAALSALRNELVHVQAVSQGSNALWIDFAAIAPRTDDALVERLLSPLNSQTSELALARSKVGGATLAFCGRLPALRKLDLRDTKVGDAELARLGAQPALEELILARTSITDASVDTLLALPALRSVHLWGCQAQVHERAAESRPAARGRSERADQCELPRHGLAHQPQVHAHVRRQGDRVLLPELPRRVRHGPRHVRGQTALKRCPSGRRRGARRAARGTATCWPCWGSG